MAFSETLPRPRASGDDRYLDYVARPYLPVAPWEGKYRSEAWFDESASGRPRLLELKRALQAGLGLDRVVFGVKERDGAPYWELYIYNYERSPKLGFKAVSAALPSDWRIGDPPPPSLNEVMLSFELTPEALLDRTIRGVHLYTISAKGGAVTSRSFLWNGGRLSPENVYLPMPLDTPARRKIFHAFAERVLARPGLGLDSVLPRAWLEDCRSACWAFKPASEDAWRLPELPNSIYLSTLRLGPLSAFLSRHGYAELLSFAEHDGRRLDHLLYDVGFDFAPGPGGPRFTKSGFYGLF